MSHRDDEARATQPGLPVLDNLHVAAPCKASWDDMAGDDRSRFCGQCDKNVYNLSAMSRAEAEALLLEKEGRLCVRYYQRADGTVLTADCPDGLRRRRRKQRFVAAAFGAMSAVTAAATLVPRGTRVADAGRPVERPAVVGTALPQPRPETMPVMGEPAPAVMGRMSPPATMGKPSVARPPEKSHKQR